MPRVISPDQPAQHLNQLLARHGTEFVEAAYATILGRQPDPQGGQQYAERVATDHDKAAIIYELATSTEGQARQQALPGIAALIATARPRAGRFRCWLQRLSRVDVTLARVGASVSALGAEADRRTRGLEAGLEVLCSRLDALAVRLDSEQSASEQALRALSAMLAEQATFTRDFEQRLISALTSASGSPGEAGAPRRSVAEIRLEASSSPREFLAALARKLSQTSEAQTLSTPSR